MVGDPNARHTKFTRADGTNVTRVSPPESFGDIWPGSRPSPGHIEHVAYPAPGSRCGCGYCGR